MARASTDLAFPLFPLSPVELFVGAAELVELVVEAGEVELFSLRMVIVESLKNKPPPTFGVMARVWFSWGSRPS